MLLRLAALVVIRNLFMAGGVSGEEFDVTYFLLEKISKNFMQAMFLPGVPKKVTLD